MNVNDKQDFQLFNNDSVISFSVYEEKLLFIHSPFSSSQLDIDKLGVSIMDQGDYLQLQFFIQGGSNYLSLFFVSSEYDALRLYFQSLRFPMHDIPRVVS